MTAAEVGRLTLARRAGRPSGSPITTSINSRGPASTYPSPRSTSRVSSAHRRRARPVALARSDQQFVDIGISEPAPCDRAPNETWHCVDHPDQAPSKVASFDSCPPASPHQPTLRARSVTRESAHVRGCHVHRSIGLLGTMRDRFKVFCVLVALLGIPSVAYAATTGCSCCDDDPCKCPCCND